MKSFLKTISFVSILSLPTLAFGQSPTDMSNFSFRLKLQSRFDFVDSYRSNQGDIFGTTARTGLNYNYKNVFGVLEFQGGSATDALTSSSATSSTNGQQELFVVRRALVGLDIFNSDMGKVSLIMGRDHNTASIVYAPDALVNLIGTNIDNMAAANSQDGIALRYAGKFGFGDVKAQVGYYNNFPITILNGGSTSSATSQTSPFSTTSKGVGDATFNTQSKSGSRAIAGQIGANVNVADGVVEARAFYSMQPNAVVSVTGGVYTASDISNIEASVGYNYKNGMLKGGVWAQSFSYGRTQTSNGTSAITSNNINYVDGATDDSFTANVIGLGVVGTSDLFGVNSLLVGGDKLTYGLGYQMVQGHAFSNSGGALTTNFSNETPNLTFYNIAAGYAQGPYSLELNYVGVNSDKPIYPGNNGKLDQDSAYLVYLVATVAL